MLQLTVALLLQAAVQAAPGPAPVDGAPPPPPAVEQVLPQAPAQVPSPTPAPAKTPRLVTGTQVELELVDALSSTTSHLGDRFTIRLVAPIAADGVELIPAGATGQGEVIDVGRAGMGGKQGKLIISARYLDLNGRHVRLRGMTLMAAGESRVDLATGVLLVPYVGLAAGFIKGGEIEIPAGARAKARLAENVELPIGQPTQSASN